MRLDWDKAKNERNIRLRGLDFADAPAMFDAPMLVLADRRREYGEKRYIGLGTVNSRVMVVVYTERGDEVIRIISFRKANSREQKRYKAVAHQLEAHRPDER